MSRYHIVVQAQHQTIANRAMAKVHSGHRTTDPGGQERDRTDQELDADPGARTFTVALTDNGSRTVAYWCSWDLAATRHDPVKVRDWLLAHGATQQEATPVPADARAQQVRQQRFAIFAAQTWTPAQVLDLLGLATLNPDTP